MILNNYQLSQVLSVIFVILNILDGHSTYIVLRPDHFKRERNPIARWIFRKLSVLRGIIIWKSVLLIALLVLIFTQYLDEPYFLNIILIIANLFFTWVVIHNYSVYKKLKNC